MRWPTWNFPKSSENILYLILYLVWIKQRHNEITWLQISFYLIFHDCSVVSVFEWALIDCEKHIGPKGLELGFASNDMQGLINH